MVDGRCVMAGLPNGSAVDKKHCLTGQSLKLQLPKGLTVQRLAGAFVDNDPTVEVGSIGEKDPGAKYPAEGLIRGRVLLQSRVYVMELFLREGAGRGVRVRTLYVAIGGGVVARHHCSGRSRSSDARCIQSSNGPTTPPLSNRGNRVRVGGSWGRRRVNGGRDDCSGTSIDAGTAGAALRAGGRAEVGHQGHCRVRGSRNRAWRQGAGGA